MYVKKLFLIVSAILISSSLSLSEERTYGEVDLTGLARNDWHLNPLGPDNTMVCNVNGPDGFLSIRSGPGTNFKINRKLNRLAIVEVDTRARQGNWVRVNTAYRNHSKSGRRIAYKTLHVQGWAHDKFLCSYLD